MSRHALPESEYTDEERCARLHAEMLDDALSHLAGLSTTWTEPTGRPYELGLGTGTLPAIIAGTM